MYIVVINLLCSDSLHGVCIIEIILANLCNDHLWEKYIKNTDFEI
jgi:hypothetical protein